MQGQTNLKFEGAEVEEKVEYLAYNVARKNEVEALEYVELKLGLV
jgi:hypothetical protein